MGFLEGIGVELIAGLLTAGLLAILGWLFRRHRRERAAEEASAPEARPLRVLVALPRPLLTLLREEGGEMVAANDWDEVIGVSRVPQLGRAWKIEAIEEALRETGAPIQARFLRHAAEADLRRALGEREGYDVLVIDAHGGRDGTIGVEGPHGESHPLSPSDLGRLVEGTGTRLAILSACHSAAACDALRDAGVSAVVGMAKSVPEDAARAYLAALLARLAQGDRLRRAHERACGALHTRWGARPGEPDLPRLAASWHCRRRRLVRPGAEGAYERLDEPLPQPAPPAPAVTLRGRALDQILVQHALLARPRPEGVSPLVTLSGFGGVGKTALARAVGRWCWERALFPDGVRFVSVTDLRVLEETLADRLLRAFDVPAPEPVPDQDEHRAKVAALRGALSDDARLLILDNFETALEDKRSSALLTELRRDCPRLHLLVTTRRWG